MSQYMEMSKDGLEEVMPRPPSLWRRRVLVLSFYLNLGISLFSIMLTGSLFANVRQVFFGWLGINYPVQIYAVFDQKGVLLRGANSGVQSLAAAFPTIHGPIWSTPIIWLIELTRLYPLPCLLIPLVSLIVLYIVLRYQARDTMLGPERYLDERQKMVRDWAQRSSYRVMKWTLLLVALGLILHAIFPGSSGQGGFLNTVNIPLPLRNMSVQFMMLPMDNAALWPVDPLHILLYYGTLLACIFLLLTVLPISIALWKKDPSRAAAGIK